MRTKEYLKTLLASNDLEEAIKVLTNLSEKLDTETQNFVLIQSASFNKLIQDEENGILTDENKRIAYNKINTALLELIEELPDDEIDLSVVKEKKASLRHILFKNKNKLIGTIWTSLGLFLAYAAFTQQTNLSVQIDANLNRIQFKNSNQSKLKINNSYDYVTISNFGVLEVPAAQLNILDDSGLTEEIKIDQEALKIQAIPENEASVVFKDVRFQKLEIAEQAELILEVPKELEASYNHLQLSFANAAIEGALILDDSLYIEANNCLFENLYTNQANTEFRFLEGLFIAPPNQTLPLSFRRGENLLTLDLEQENTDDYLINQETPLRITDIQFIIPNENGKILSSLTGGSFSFLDQKDQVYLETPIDKGLFLGLKDYESLKLNLLQVKGNSMQVKLLGQVGQLLAGLDKATLKLQNPSKLRYLISTKPTFLFLILGLAGAITLGLLLYFKN